MRYFTTPSVKAARKSVGWSLFFIFLLYSSAPMLLLLEASSNINKYFFYFLDANALLATADN
jgi:cation/acetate symporter